MGKISFNSYTGNYDGYNNEGELIIVQEDTYLDEYQDIVNTMLEKGYSVEEAEMAATYFLSDPEEWPLED